MKRLIAFLTLRFLIVVAPMVIAGCGGKREHKPEKPSTMPTAQVRVQTVQSKSRPLTEEVVGTVRAKWHATLAAQVSGRIEEMPVRLGDRIQKGQLIARLNAAEIGARLAQAEASLEQAERDWKRISALFEQQGVTRAEFDAAQSRQQVAKAAVAEARAMMNYLEVLAPFDAVVTRKWADVGDLAAPGKPLVDVEDPAVLQLEANVPEASASQIRRDARLAVRIDGTGRELSGVVSEIAPVADSVSRTLRVTLDLPATDGLMSGQFARLLVPTGQADSLRVPAVALLQRGQLEIVFSVTNQRAWLHLVKTGKRVGEEVEILSGLNAGDSVVVSGADQLTDGQPLEAQ